MWAAYLLPTPCFSLHDRADRVVNKCDIRCKLRFADRAVETFELLDFLLQEVCQVLDLGPTQSDDRSVLDQDRVIADFDDFSEGQSEVKRSLCKLDLVGIDPRHSLFFAMN